MSAKAAVRKSPDLEHLRTARSAADSGTSFDLVPVRRLGQQTRQLKRKERSPWHCRHEFTGAAALDPFEPAQREFDGMLSRFIGGREGNGDAAARAVRRRRPRGRRPHLRRGRAARLQEGRGRHHAGEPDADDRRRAARREQAGRRPEGRPAAARAALQPLPPQLHAAADRRRASGQRQARRRRADDHAEQARGDQAAEDQGRVMAPTVSSRDVRM